MSETPTLAVETLKAMLDWRVTLDILVVTLGIFFLYRTLRTTAWKIVSGVIIATFIFMVARIIGLRTIDWIYSNLSQVMLLSLIIVFQPEIRKIFEKFASIRPRESVSGGARLSYILSDVAFALAKAGQGGLLVIAGKDSIAPVASKGIALNADPSFPILMSIFDPHSVGHDGAAVIEHDKITSFGVRLPLSQSGKLPEEIGTRHHAAMGLSEISDALIIAVSEERATITVFEHATATLMTDKNLLASKIIAHLRDRASYEPPGVIDENRGKVIIELLVSLLLALLFWSTVILTQSGN